MIIKESVPKSEKSVPALDFRIGSGKERSLS